MNIYELIKIRILSFLYQLGTTLVLMLITYLLSPAFAELVQQHFGAIASGLVMLIIPEIVKHVRNMNVLQQSQNQLGGGSQYRLPTLI